MGFRRVLIALDDSPAAAHAADVGIALARSLGAEVALAHAVDPASGYAPEGGVPAVELTALAEADARRLLAGFRTRATLQAAPHEFVPIGKAASAIVRAATDWPADLIVIASHGRSGLPRALLGSVAEGVMRHAPCPVLVVRARS